MAIIPDTYEAWKQCITQICGIPLTADFIAQRLTAMNDMNDYMTARFVTLYGEQQRLKTLEWLTRAANETRKS